MPQSRDIAEFSSSTTGNSLGATTGIDAVDASMLNAARLGEIQRMGLTGGVFLSPQFDGGFGMFYLPSSFGTLAIFPTYVQDSDPTGLNSFLAVRLGYGRLLTENLSFGTYIVPSFGQSTAGSYFGIGIEPALNYNFRSALSFGSGFGLYDFSLFLTTRNLSLNIGETAAAARPSLRFGLQSSFYRNNEFDSYWLLEALGVGDFTTMPLHFGLGASWSFWHVRGGYMFSQESELFRGLSLGTGLKFDFESGQLRADYAFLPSNEVRKEAYHFLSIGGNWGSVDSKPPIISGSVSPGYFSPNHDGAQDYTFFNVQVQDDSPILSWVLSIQDISGREVRRFQHDDREIQRGFGFREFYESAFNRRESLVVPPVIRWDGTANRLAIEESGLGAESALPDGAYRYSFIVTDIHNNVSKPWVGSVVIDTQAPQARLSLENELFSPNNDGNFDQLIILQETFGAAEDTWVGTIRDMDGKAVIEYSWEDAPPTFVWNGQKPDGSEAPEGLYRYELAGLDYAGNRSLVKTRPFTLTRRVDTIDLILSADGLSPNGDKVLDSVSIRPEVQFRTGITSWEIVITSKKPEPDSPKPGLVAEFNGVTADSLPASIVWDGKSSGGAIQPDGLYFITFRIRYANGNSPSSFPKPLIIDTRPPLLGVEADLRVFIPDGDGNAEEQVFRLDIQDDSGIAAWELSVFEVQYDEKNTRSQLPFKKFSGTDNWTEKIFWDGKGDSGRLVESATIYDYRLAAVDRFGNRGVSADSRFETGIMVLTTNRGLQIRLSAIEFDLGKTTLKKSSYAVIEKLATVLQKYPNYAIKIEGHTDDIGDDEVNLKISEKRALSVMEYLIQNHGIDKDRLTYEGRGEVFPLLPNDNWYNRSRNRRVEIILLK